VTSLHSDAIVFDGLVVSRWGRDVFESMRAGGITAANCTCAVWEGFDDAMANVAEFKGWFREHGDVIRQVRSVEDIRAAKREGRVGIVLGWQNTSPIGDDLRRRTSSARAATSRATGACPTSAATWSPRSTSSGS
jgi:membrane dipeptidase